MTEAEFEACLQRVWDVLPDDAFDAARVLGAACNAFIAELEKHSPGLAMDWMSTLQDFFDKAGVRT